MLHHKACNAGAESTEIIAPNMSGAYTHIFSLHAMSPQHLSTLHIRDGRYCMINNISGYSKKYCCITKYRLNGFMASSWRTTDVLMCVNDSVNLYNMSWYVYIMLCHKYRKVLKIKSSSVYKINISIKYKILIKYIKLLYFTVMWYFWEF